MQPTVGRSLGWIDSLDRTCRELQVTFKRALIDKKQAFTVRIDAPASAVSVALITCPQDAWKGKR